VRRPSTDLVNPPRTAGVPVPDSTRSRSSASLGQRQTRQRDVIAEVIDQAPGPLTVPEILERAQQELQGIGIATVYRTIKLLLEAERIQTVILPSGETRYEPTGRGHHHHFHCRQCGRVFDLDTCPVSVARGRYPEGYVVEDHELTLYGLCPACS
jgi:Fur family transcriptional regulator, ferric uptake regulator